MTCSLPMIMSSFPYWKELFSDYAIFVDPQSPEDIAEKIKWCYDNRATIRLMGKKGQEIVEKKYNWSVEADRLRNNYESLLK